MSSSDSSDSSFFTFTFFWAGIELWRGQDLPLVQHCCWGGSASPCFADEAPHVDFGQSLCKLAWPERFSIYISCFNEGIDLILWDCHLILLQEDEGRADGGKLQGRGHGSGEHSAGASLKDRVPYQQLRKELPLIFESPVYSVLFWGFLFVCLFCLPS